MSKPNRSELANAILVLIDKNKKESVLAKEIASYLVEERRTSDLDMIMRDIATLRQKSGILEAVVTSAFPLSAAVLADVKKLLRQQFPTAKTILIDQRIDTDLVGGLRLEMGGKQLDTTIRTKLTKLKAAIV